MNSDKRHDADAIAGLAALKLATTLNKRDNDFKRDEGNISYFIDADIYSFFIDSPRQRMGEAGGRSGGRERPAINMFLGFEGSARTYLQAEYEVAGYIFSGRLPGQHKAGKLLFSNSHLREITNINRAVIDRKPPPRPEKAEESYPGETELRKLSESMLQKQKEGIQDQEILLLSDEASEMTRHLFEHALETQDPKTYRSLETTLAIRHLQREQRWSSAGSLESYREAVDAVARDDVNEWCGRIACARNPEPYTKSRSEEIFAGLSDWAQERILYDAQTVAELIQLNKHLPKDRKALLITATGGIHRAYTEWFLNPKNTERSVSSYILRQPLQYIPMINLLDYAEVFELESNAEIKDKIFHDMVSSLDAFLDPSTTRPSFSTVLHYYFVASTHRMGGPLEEEFQRIQKRLEWWEQKRELRDVLARWRLAYANSTLITLPVVERRHRAQAKILEQALEQAGGDLLTAQRNIVANIEIDHLRSSLVALAEEVRQEINSLPQGLVGGDKVRVVLPIFIDPEIYQYEELHSALRGSLLDATIYASRMERSGATDASAPPSIAEIVSGVCLSLALGGWRRARYLCEVGIELGKKAADEFKYLYALAVRFDCRDHTEFRKAISYLSQIQSSHGDDARQQLRDGRAQIEKGVLHLIAGVRRLAGSKLQTVATWPDFKNDGQLESIGDLLLTALEHLESGVKVLRDVAAEPLREARDRLLLQASVNVLCAYGMLVLADVKPDERVEALASTADRYAGPYYAVGDELRPVGALCVEVYRHLKGQLAQFPGPKSGDFIEQVSNTELLEKFPVYRRLIAGSDIDIAKSLSPIVRIVNSTTGAAALALIDLGRQVSTIPPALSRSLRERPEKSGAEGATAPETLRQTDRRGMRLWKAAAPQGKGSPTE